MASARGTLGGAAAIAAAASGRITPEKRTNMIRKALEMAKNPEAFRGKEKTVAAKFARYMNQFIGSPYQTSSNNRLADVDGSTLYRSRWAYNPDFASLAPGLKPEDPNEQEYFLGAFEDYAMLLDTIVLRVHRRYNMIEYRSTGANVLVTPTTIARQAYGFPEPSIFMFEPAYYEDKPHPYDAEGCLPGVFIRGCMFIMEQLLEKIWGHNMYEGLTSERDFLYEKFLRIAHEYGVEPAEVEKLYEISHIREFLEVFLHKTNRQPKTKLVCQILSEHPSWTFSKELNSILEKGNYSTAEGVKELKMKATDFLGGIVRDCLSTRREDRLHEIGLNMMHFKVPKGAKQAYEAAMLEIMPREAKLVPTEFEEDPIDMGTHLLRQSYMRDEEVKLPVGEDLRYKLVKNLPRRRIKLRQEFWEDDREYGQELYRKSLYWLEHNNREKAKHGMVQWLDYKVDVHAKDVEETTSPVQDRALKAADEAGRILGADLSDGGDSEDEKLLRELGLGEMFDFGDQKWSENYKKKSDVDLDDLFKLGDDDDFH
eukprot:TRINITY_DN17472_c0_g1_i3.p1 TRINITY_DN17472_c0_g1~~TRINITY_DN17472_c0_g1_i3.p1  ORF type:complete len:540 (-),score=159.54 TRINITY_DN17472_c0_g1_i3:951-2570(-)